MFLWKAFISTARSFVIAHAILLYGAILAIKLSVIPVGAAIFCFGGFLSHALKDWNHSTMVITLRDTNLDGVYSQQLI